MSGAPIPLRQPWQPAPSSEAAAAWALRLEQGELSEAEQQRFADWLAADAQNVAAYENAIWALDAAARHAGEADIMALRGAALQARAARHPIWGWTGGLAAAAAAAALLAVWTIPGSRDASTQMPTSVAGREADSRAGDYRTGVGERSAINLPDGSVATLDTDSRIRVAYSDRERAVHLLKGQALFEVAHGQPAPFQVYAGGQRITAVGTIFNVRIVGDEVRVSMVEGRVKVRPAPTAPTAGNAPVREVTLSQGEAAVAAAARPFVVRSVEANDVTAWKGGQLVFNDVPLSEAVAEVNRYTRNRVRIADARAGALRVSGVFKSNDPDRFSHAMTEILPVEIQPGPDGETVLRSAGR